MTLCFEVFSHSPSFLCFLPPHARYWQTCAVNFKALSELVEQTHAQKLAHFWRLLPFCLQHLTHSLSQCIILRQDVRRVAFQRGSVKGQQTSRNPHDAPHKHQAALLALLNTNSTKGESSWVNINCWVNLCQKNNCYLKNCTYPTIIWPWPALMDPIHQTDTTSDVRWDQKLFKLQPHWPYFVQWERDFRGIRRCAEACCLPVIGYAGPFQHSVAGS